MTIIGIDPGLGGALVIMTPTASYYPAYQTMPTIGAEKGKILNLGVIIELLSLWNNGTVAVYLENVHSMPQQGVASSFKFGRGLGQVEGICAALNLPVHYVTPQAWKKLILAGLDWRGNKAMTLQYAKSAWPRIEWPRNQQTAIGIADALCIAEFGRREQMGMR
jgi:crossover junction endodeoxyribonuclease RuvC